MTDFGLFGLDQGLDQCDRTIPGYPLIDIPDFVPPRWPRGGPAEAYRSEERRVGKECRL